ncbi:MAG: polyphosphate kinase [Herpetosiphonaceae bacterium]|nr:MAG: polyphosphate kinase [Herpetosiphonaceae bacterium]
MDVIPHQPPPSAERYINRELSWLAFNRRVLEEAANPGHPILERIKFLSIFSTNLDEFFMIRVAGLKAQIAAGVTQLAQDGMTPHEQLRAIKAAVESLVRDQRRLFYEELIPELCRQGIELLAYGNLTSAERSAVDRYFEQEIFPILTPLAIDPSHPFPHISNLSLNLAVVVRSPAGQHHIARVKVPEVLPRLLPLTQLVGPDAYASRIHRFVWIEDVILANLSALFPGMAVVEAYPFRITRNADMEIQEDEAADLLRMIEQSVRQRRFGSVVRFSTITAFPDDLLEFFIKELQITREDVYQIDQFLALSSLRELLTLDRPDLKDPPFAARKHPAFTTAPDFFSAIRQRDILLHHPYDSFEPVIDFIRAAAEDPAVLAIKQTLYRVGRNSPVVEALMLARERGKQVAVLVELKARFDEESNIEWARTLERAGVHVAYGLLGLKTHCKIAMVVRRDHDGMRRYVHLATGNYNLLTAQVYTDLSLFTCHPEIGADASDLFNYLTGYSVQRSYRQLLVAPVNLREQLTRLIEREIEHQREAGNGHLIFKVNALVDPQMIELLYRASQTGVQIDLIVRGICCLRPGVPGMSETIRVRSIVGRFLEHSRIYYFFNNGAEEIYLGSADLMQRNLDRRVETLFPIVSPQLRDYLHRNVLNSALDDTSQAWILQADGTYCRAAAQPDSPPLKSQAWLLARHLEGGGV